MVCIEKKKDIREGVLFLCNFSTKPHKKSS